MPTEVSEIGPCQRRIKITIPKEQIRETFDSTWAQARQSVTLKGFRPGKVPRKILERKFGKQVQEEVKQQLINDAYRDAMSEHNLSPVRHPEIDGDSIQIDPEQSLDFEITVEIRPEFELADFKGIEVGAPPVDVRSEHINQELERLRGQRATLEKIEEGVAAKDDMILADVSYQVDGAIVMHHEDVVVDTRQDEIESIPTEGGIGGFAGKAVGATVTVPVHLPRDFEPSGFAGAEAQLICSVKEIQRATLPELDEEFARGVGAEGVDDLREKLKAQIERQLNSERERFIDDRIFDDLIRRVDFELPPDLLEEATRQSIREMEEHLIRAKMPEGEARSHVASQSDRIRQDQARSLRISFLIDKIAEKEKVFVTENEIESAVKAIASVQNMDPQALFDEMYDTGRLSSLRAQILESKVRKLLRESAKVLDTSVDPAES